MKKSGWSRIGMAFIVALMVMAGMAVAQFEIETITWGTSEATLDTLVGTTADTSNVFRLVWRPNKSDGKMSDRIGIMITATQITDSTNVTTYLDGSVDRTAWAALATGPAIVETDISANVDSIFTVAKADLKAMPWGRIRTVPAVAGDSTGYGAKLTRSY